MSAEISTPKTIWIITEETSQISATTSETSNIRGARDGRGIERIIDAETTEETQLTKKETTNRKAVEVAQLKQEMQGFLQAMRETLEIADVPGSQIRLDEVELSVEINGEGKVSLFGVGGKAGGKGAMTFKFKRK